MQASTTQKDSPLTNLSDGNSNNNIGVMLLNLGTPDTPTASNVRKYLKEFLSDRRVIHLNPILWWCILNLVILNIRPKKVAKLYQSIWTDQGSPLLAISNKIANKLRLSLNLPIEVAMTYGNPSIASVGRKLGQQGVNKIICLPMFPQYSATSTAAAFDQLTKALAKCPDVPELIFIKDYHDHPLYVQAIADSVQAFWNIEQSQADQLIMSFHGIPQSYADKGDSYPKQCERSAKLIANSLNLKENQWQQTYQSRFGRQPWLMPYTDKVTSELGKKQQTIDIICPGFPVDCLETLEEIAETNQEDYLKAGGKQYRYIPCLNDSDSQIALYKALIEKYLH